MSLFSSIISAAPIIGPAISGLTDFFGAKEQNKANQAVAASQMAFQERMSGTAYQRAVKDMRLAGINPMLAYSKGGATTPGGAGLPMANVAGGLSKTVSSALQMRRLNAETDRLEADSALSREKFNTERRQQENITEDTYGKYAQRQITQQNLSSAYAAAAAGKTQEEINKSWLGKIGLIIKSLSPFTSTARDLRGLSR